jgi:hypothetical protein
MQYSCDSYCVAFLPFRRHWCCCLTDSAQKHDLSLLSDVVGYDKYLKPLVQRAKAERNGHGHPVTSHPAGDTPAEHDLADTV